MAFSSAFDLAMTKCSDTSPTLFRNTDMGIFGHFLIKHIHPTDQIGMISRRQ